MFYYCAIKCPLSLHMQMRHHASRYLSLAADDANGDKNNM